MSAFVCLKDDLTKQDLLYKLNDLFPFMPWNSMEAFQFTQNQGNLIGTKLHRKCLWNQISSRKELSILIFPWCRVHTDLTTASLETVSISKSLWQQNAETFEAGAGIQQCQHHMQFLSPGKPFSSAAATEGEDELDNIFTVREEKSHSATAADIMLLTASVVASSVYTFTKTWAGLKRRVDVLPTV